MVKQDIKVVNDILKTNHQYAEQTFQVEENSKSDYYAKYSLIYPYTNDVLSEYEKEVSGKTILTVAGSGDQALMAVKNGATKIQMFDINKLSLYYANLKLAAVKALTYKEYIEFFNPDSDLFFTDYNLTVFDKILMQLPMEDAIFWNSIYTQFFCFNNYKLINECYSFDKSPIRYKDSYDDIKNKLYSCEFLAPIESNLFDIDEKIGNTIFDAAIFSNITSYIKTQELLKLKKVVEGLNKKMSVGGIIQIGQYVKHQYYYDGEELSKREDLLLMFNEAFNCIDQMDRAKTYIKYGDNAITGFYKKYK